LICYIHTNDESCIYLDAPRFYTFAPIGVNRVPAITCGAERVRLSTAWTSAKNGFKLPIYGIIPRKNPLPLDATKVINNRPSYMPQKSSRIVWSYCKGDSCFEYTWENDRTSSACRRRLVCNSKKILQKKMEWLVHEWRANFYNAK
jgi:hypothetical protein